MLKKPSIQEDRRLEILGILLLAISVFIFVSLLGWNPSEDWSWNDFGPLASENAKITNPMGQLGMFVSWVFIKKGFGFSSLILPALGIFWGWILFSKKDNEHPIKVTLYSLLLILLLSISIGVISIQANIDYNYSGELGGQVADFFIDMFSIYGCILFLISSYLMLIRAYFDLDYYKPLITFKEKIILWKTNYIDTRKKFIKEEEK